ncbi:MAG: aminotransferase class V [Verrucomicrobia bacterium]|nr:MAG: aminotransferase class V [Verrucomicrobiota bacterium]
MEIDRARRTDAEENVIAELEANEEFRRREFPICARKIYCAHAADAPLPGRVAEAMRDAIEDASNNEKQFDKALGLIADTRQLAANFLGTETEEISLTGPTSNGLNAVANGLDWSAGDEVVCYLDDYPADVYPWLNLERSGVKPVLLQTPRLGEITPEIVESALTKRTRLVALASAHNISGYRVDVETIGALCSERGVLFSLDAIQTLGAFPIALKHVDFLSAGAQKWMLGPSGAGILFVKNSRHELLRPMIIGGWNVESPNFIAQREIKYAEGGRKFEPGGYNNVPIAGMQAAIALLDEVGLAKISERILSLVATLKNKLAPVDLEFLSPKEELGRSSFLTFRSRRIPAEKLANTLAENDVVVSLRVDRANRSWLRVSPHFYNTVAEMERVAEILNHTQP